MTDLQIGKIHELRHVLPGWPHLPPYLTTKDGLFAKCPKCGRITSIRVCYGCKELMCNECLTEHQITCLREEK